MSKLRIALSILGVFAISIVVIQLIASLLTRDHGSLGPADQLAATNSARVSLIQLLGALGLAGGLIFTANTYLLARHSQRADRFAKAIAQIGDDSETVRAGGAFSLWLLAGEDSSYWPVVEHLLAATIRERSSPPRPSRGDVQAALTVLGRRPVRPAGEKGLPIDLRGADLSGLTASGGNLERVLMDNAQLLDTQFSDTRLVRANLKSAHLDRAILSHADLTNAVLTDATVPGADFYRTVLTGTEITGCNLTDALHVTAEQLATARAPRPSQPT